MIPEHQKCCLNCKFKTRYMSFEDGTFLIKCAIWSPKVEVIGLEEMEGWFPSNLRCQHYGEKGKSLK
jgi:hypothetical protein